MPVPSSDDNIAGRCDNSTDTYDKSDTSDTSDTPNKADKPQTPAKKKRRKWAVCKAKMKSGALKLKALVNSSSDSSDSESDSDSGRNGGSGSGADSGFGEDFTRPFPLKSSGSFSFSDVSTVVVAPSEGGVETTSRAATEPCLPTTTSCDVDANPCAGSGAGNGARDCVRENGVPSIGSPGLLGEAWIDSVSVAGERAGAWEEDGGEPDESTAWELSSSSEESKASSSVRSSLRLRSRSRSKSGDRNLEHINSPGSQAPSPCASSPPSSSRQVPPESPGSYVARMHKILAHVQQTTTAPANRSTHTTEACGGCTSAAKPSASCDLLSSPRSSSETVASRTTVASVTTTASGAPTPVHGCWRDDDSVEQTERGETSGTDDVELVRETPVSDCSREKQRNALLKQQKKKEEQQAGVSEQQERWEEGGTYEDDYEEEMVYCEEGRRDLELMTAAVAAMIGMMIPERYEWMLWLACCAVTLWFPLQKRFSWPPCWRTQLSSKPALSPPPSRQPSQAVSIGDGNEDDEPPPPYVELDHVDVYSKRQVQAEAEEPLPCQSANGNGRVPLVRDASRKILTEASCNGGPDWRDDSVAEGEGGGVSQRYRQMVTGLSETEREFVGSAGEEEKNRLLHQCVEYANYDVPNAIKVCSNFCKFRLKENWRLVLSARDLEGPLRSRAHTLVAARDRIDRGILTFSPGKLDTNKAPPAAYHKMLCYVLQEVLKEHQDLQTKGLVLLVDARGVSLGLLRHFTLADYMRGMRMLGGAFPVKLKAIRILHLNRAIKIALSIAMPLFSAKMRARVEIVSNARASDGSFTKELADPSNVPAELGIKGTWTGSDEYWSEWVEQRVSTEKRLGRSSRS